MNKRVLNRLRQIEANISIVAEELGFDRKAAYRYAFEQGLACARADTHTCAHADTRTCASEHACVPTPVRESASTRDLNSNSINLSTKGSGVKVADATTRAPGISLGFMFRNLPQSIPHHFALWWWRSMKDRDWVLANGGFVDGKNWKYQISAWYKHVDVNESAEAKETYERFFGKSFPRQEETAAEVWKEKCRGCDNYWSGHCVACANVPPQCAAECARFKKGEE